MKNSLLWQQAGAWWRQAACVTGLVTAGFGANAQTLPTGALPTGSIQLRAVGNATRAQQAVVAPSAPVSQAAAISSWSSVAPLVQRRSQHGAVAIGTNIYAWGGYIAPTNNSIPSALFSSLEIYNTTTNTWRSGAAMPVAERSQAVATSGGFIYAFGGNASTTNSFRYSPSTDTWSTIAPLPTGTFEAGAATGPDGRVYVFGGLTPGVVASNITQIYNPATNTWTAGAPMPTGRNGQAAITDANGLLHVIGGATSSLVATTVHEVYNPATNSWTTAAPLPQGVNQSGATLGPDGNLYIIGGKDSFFNNQPPFYNTVYVYSPSTNTWTQDTSLPQVLGETQSVTVGSSIYTIAGTNGDQQSVVYRTDLCTPPVLTVPANQTVAAAAGQCSASVAFAASATNQATLTYTIGNTPITSPYTFPVGTTTVTATATNTCGTATGTFTVTVQDRQAPTLLAAGFITALESDGTRTIEAADVDYGSFDNCGGIVSMTISPRTFTCANLGPNQVTFTATDNSGNSASQTVTVIIVDNTAPTLRVAGFQTRLENGTRTIVPADIDYGSFDNCGLASVTISPSTFTCANVGSNPVTVTVRDNSGNVVTQTVDVIILADGTCTSSVASRGSNASSSTVLSTDSQLQAYPNPVTDQATIAFRPTQAGKAQVKVYNQLGVLVATLYDGQVEASRLYNFTFNGAPLANGVYNCQLITNGKVTNQRLLISK